MCIAFDLEFLHTLTIILNNIGIWSGPKWLWMCIRTIKPQYHKQLTV